MNRVNRRRGQQSLDPGTTTTARATRTRRRNCKLVLGGILTFSMFLLLFNAFSFTSPSTILFITQYVRNEAIQYSHQVSFVECTINGGDANINKRNLIQITVRHDLSPIASQVFVDLVQARHFDDIFIFRVLKGFIAQWGIQTSGGSSSTDEVNNKGMRNNNKLKPAKTKDIVHEKTLSNIRGTLSFAGGNPATCQVFVNLGNNQRLDKEGSRPFATVSNSSMEYVFDTLYTGYPDGQGQVETLKLGKDKMRQVFPHMSLIDACHVVSHFSTL